MKVQMLKKQPTDKILVLCSFQRLTLTSNKEKQNRSLALSGHRCGCGLDRTVVSQAVVTLYSEKTEWCYLLKTKPSGLHQFIFIVILLICNITLLIFYKKIETKRR